jgi:hypothetical protein
MRLSLKESRMSFADSANPMEIRAAQGSISAFSLS